MAAKGVIVSAKSCECAEPMGQIVEVGMIQGNRSGSAVEAGSREYAIGEVVCEVGVFIKELLQGLG